MAYTPHFNVDDSPSLVVIEFGYDNYYALFPRAIVPIHYNWLKENYTTQIFWLEQDFHMLQLQPVLLYGSHPMIIEFQHVVLKHGAAIFIQYFFH